jgi:uncharacterized lipoprotein YehR (DUF1307 family)
MKNLKNIITILALVAVVMLSACGSDDDPKPVTPEPIALTEKERVMVGLNLEVYSIANNSETSDKTIGEGAVLKFNENKTGVITQNGITRMSFKWTSEDDSIDSNNFRLLLNVTNIEVDVEWEHISFLKQSNIRFSRFTNDSNIYTYSWVDNPNRNRIYLKVN